MPQTYFIVTGVVTYNNKLLILKKSPTDRNYPNKWSFCSGYIKEFESAEDAVLREIKEETKLDCAIKTYGKPIAVIDGEKRWFIATYLCIANSDKVALSHENVEYRWVTKDELKNYNMVPGLLRDLSAVGFL